jgi:hypothetical protein
MGVDLLNIEKLKGLEHQGPVVMVNLMRSPSVLMHKFTGSFFTDTLEVELAGHRSFDGAWSERV